MSFNCTAPNQRVAFYLRLSLSCHFSVVAAVNFFAYFCAIALET